MNARASFACFPRLTKWTTRVCCNSTVFEIYGAALNKPVRLRSICIATMLSVPDRNHTRRQESSRRQHENIDLDAHQL